MSATWEEETDPRRFSPHRLAHYCIDLSLMFRTNRVVPVVVFLRRDPARGLVLGTERRVYLAFDYLGCALGDMSAEPWLDSRNVVARICLPNMEVPAGRSRLDVYTQATHGLLALEADPNQRAKYFDFIHDYAKLTDDEHRLYRQRHPEEYRIMMGLNRQAREEGISQGRREGISQGRREGIAEGERTVLERQLRRRFGRLPPAVRETLGAAATDDLEAWADNVLDATTLEDVFEPGQRAG